MSRHRVLNRAKAAETRSGRGRLRAPRRFLKVSTWLGAGVLTLGVGAALAGGTAVAHADKKPHPPVPPGHTTTDSTGTNTGTTGPGVPHGINSVAVGAPTNNVSLGTPTDPPGGAGPQPATTLTITPTNNPADTDPTSKHRPQAVTTGTDPVKHTAVTASTMSPKHDVKKPPPVGGSNQPPIPVGKKPVSVTVAVTPNGTFAFVVNKDSHNVSVINTADPQAKLTPIDNVGTHPAAVTVVKTANGTFAYVVSEDKGELAVIDTKNNTVTKFDIGGHPSAVAVVDTISGPVAYVADTESRFVSVINANTGQPVHDPIPVGSNASAVVTDGQFIYVGTRLGVTVIDRFTYAVTRNVPVNGGADSGAGANGLATDGAGTLYEVTPVNTVAVINGPTVTNTINLARQGKAVAVSPDGTKIAVAEQFGIVEVFNTAETTKPLQTIPVGGSLTGVAFNGNNELYVSSAKDTVEVFPIS